MREKIEKRFEEKGYKVLGEVVDTNTPLTLECKKGYRYYITPKNGLYGEMSFSAVHAKNPYSINNIKKWLKKENSPFILKTNIYTNRNTYMYWEDTSVVDSDLRVFKARWSDISNGSGNPNTKIDRIAESQRNKNAHEEIRVLLDKHNSEWEIVDVYNNNKQRLLFLHKDGYYSRKSLVELRKGSKLLKFSAYAPEETLLNIDLYLSVKRPHISRVSTTFAGVGASIEMRCDIHGSFETTWNNFYDREQDCPLCTNRRNSKGEKRIESILLDRGVTYVSEKTFEGLVGTGGGLLMFDFYIPSYNILLEYHGKQHYEPIEWFGGLEGFTTQQKNDKIKREFSLNNGIKLYEISYKEFEDIGELLNNMLK